MTALRPEVRAMVRRAWDAPELGLPFFGDTAEAVLSIETHRNIAKIVYEAREQLTPERPGARGVDIEAVYLAACYYAARLKHLTGEGSWEWTAFEVLFAVVRAVRPDLIPEPYREMFDERPPRLVAAHEILNVVGNVLYEAGAEAEDESALTLTTVIFSEARTRSSGGISEPHITFNLGSALLVLSGLVDGDRNGHGDPADMRRAALGYMRKALALLPIDDPAREVMLATLIDAQEESAEPAAPRNGVHGEVDRYMQDGGQDRLGPVAEQMRAAAAEADGIERAHRLIELSQVLRMRFEMDGELDNLKESITAMREALGAPLNAESRATANSFLGLAVLDRFVALRDPADLELATNLTRAACTAATAGSQSYGQWLTNLAAVLTARFDEDRDPATIDEAVAHLLHAVAVTPTTQPDQPVMMIKLAVALRRRGMHAENDLDVDLAETILRQVAGDPGAGPHAHLARLELGELLALRGLDRRASPDLADAVVQCRATTMEATEDIRTRLLAVIRWAMLSTLLGDLDEASTAYGVALDDVFPKLTARTLGRASQESRLREADDLASDAAAVEIAAGRPRQALIRLEQGRGVLLAQALQLRGRLDDLVRADSDLAQRFEQVCAALVASQAGPEQRRVLAAEFDRIVTEIRGLDGFEDFHRPPEWAQLSKAGVYGPVAVVNVARMRSDVLLLRRGARGTEVEVLPLPAVTPGEVRRRADSFRTAIAELAAPGIGSAERYRHDQEVKRVLRWLGEHVVGPVLEKLGHDRPVEPGAEAPRMWWCPTGLLSLMPLHAAILNSRPAPAEYAQDRVASSYVPTLGALLHARARTAPSVELTSLVAVAAQAGEGYAPLTALEEELAATDELPTARLVLRNGDATPTAVLAALRSHSHAHLACHGVRDGADPSRSRLLLEGGELTISRLAAERLLDAELAYLAACHSAAVGEDLADESVSVASAFQLSGFRQVIGSLWTVEDAMGPLLARAVYRLLASPDTRGAARALHRALAELRTHPRYREPLYWASVIHIGP
ncbi:CHAT domain-containing protein [Kitasatospora sp. NPDC093679]|uniref:CHAT domain-containing protein n=1 Tax=Kitasatospora sp. NPDC093679 TaxID=3154983 RepID=UPI0034386CC3